jgi:hypothetical protein
MINRLLTPDIVPLVPRIGQEPREQVPTTAANAIEIDLGFSHPAGVLRRLGV